MIRRLNGSLRGKKVAVLGYAFKKDTGDTRESQAAAVVRLLQQETPREIAIFDPKCEAEVIEAELKPAQDITVCTSALEACDQASAILVLTEWDQFRFPATTCRRHDTSLRSDVRLQGDLAAEPECDADCKECANAGPTRSSSNESLDWPQVATRMSAPLMVFDGRGILDASGLEALGLRVEAIGKASWSCA